MIKEKHLSACTVVPEYHEIKPALVLYFEDHTPMPIRWDRWPEYFELIYQYGVV